MQDLNLAGLKTVLEREAATTARYDAKIAELEKELSVIKRAIEIYESDVRTVRFRFRHYIEAARKEQG
jgi:hypothetical protein